MQDSRPRDQAPLLLIDASLADRPLAQALHLVGYNSVATTEQFQHSTPDPVLIEWVGLQGGIWITADKKAKSKHAKEIENAGIHILWVRRDRKQGMSTKAQLLLLLWVIDPILQEIGKVRRPCRFLAYYSGTRPKWEQL